MNNNIELVADIPGLISIFGDSLYSDFGSVLRELVQNGHDAILLSDNIEDNNFVNVQWNDYSSRLIVSDNGIGMSEDEIVKSLNNFAQSDKKNIARGYDLKYEDLIGQYGVGFLSAMAASDHLIVVTSKIDNEYIKWEYKEGESKAHLNILSENEYTTIHQDYNLKPRKSGTSVICNLKKSVIIKYDIDEEEIRQDLKKYVALLPIPIYFNDEKINYTDIILKKDNYKNDTEWEKIIYDLHEEDVKLLIPLDDAPEEFKISGVLYIKNRSSYWSDPKIDIYVKGIFVVKNPVNIIPEWANFIGGIINSNGLSRIVSGENIKDNQLARDFKKYLESKLLNTISQISKKSFKYYRGILGVHDDTLKGKAVDIDGLLEHLWDKIPITSTGGKSFVLNDYLSLVERKQDKKIIYTVREPSEISQAEIISNSTGIPILILVNSSDEYFIKKVAEEEKIELSSASTLAQNQFNIPSNQDKYNILIDDGLDLGLVNIDARDFDPEYVPAIIVNDPNVSNQKEAMLQIISQAEKNLNKSLFDKLKDVLSSKKDNIQMSFYINTRNKLINDLIQSTSEDTRKSILLALYNIAFMNVYRDLNPSNLRIVYESIGNTMSNLIEFSNKPYIEPTILSGFSENEMINLNNHQILHYDSTIVIHDIDSSSWIISNLHEEATIIYKKFTDKLERLANKYYGFIDKFTGDGAIILFNNIEGKEPSARRAVDFSREVIIMTKILYDSLETRRILQAHQINYSGSRIAITHGRCSFSNYGGKISAFGVPLIEATRIIGDKELYKNLNTILITEEVFISGKFRQSQVETTDNHYIANGVIRPLVISKIE